MGRGFTTPSPTPPTSPTAGRNASNNLFHISEDGHFFGSRTTICPEESEYVGFWPPTIFVGDVRVGTFLWKQLKVVCGISRLYTQFLTKPPHMYYRLYLRLHYRKKALTFDNGWV